MDKRPVLSINMEVRSQFYLVDSRMTPRKISLDSNLGRGRRKER